MINAPGETTARLRNLDAARTASAIAVVWLHVSAEVVTTAPAPTSLDWWLGNIADAFSRWCVPVFVMPSGALLIPKARKQDPAAFLRARLPRLVFVTIAWTLLYAPLTLQTTSLPSFLKSIVGGNPHYHLWFMYMLVGLYAAAPFLQRLIDALDGINSAVLVFACFTLSALSETMRVFYPSPSVFPLAFLPYVGYFFAGHLLATRPAWASARVLITVVCLAASGVAILTGALVPLIGTRSWALMYGYLNPLVIIMSISMYAYLLTAPFGDAPAKLAPLTFGIYLIHPAILLGFKECLLSRICG